LYGTWTLLGIELLPWCFIPLLSLFFPFAMWLYSCA
jgi:hypothetical protein